MTKQCFKCGDEKPRSEFYRHDQMADGHLGKCKKCTMRDVAEHRAKNIDAVRQYDRDRAKTELRKLGRSSIIARWREKWPERRQAHSKLQYALRAGRLTKRFECERCGVTPGRIEAHHRDYSKPLDVQWLCKPCHAKADAERRQVA